MTESKKVIISFVGTGNYSENGYDKTSYLNFPNGKAYSSAFFLHSYLEYLEETNQKLDKLFIIGTYTSDWSALLEDEDAVLNSGLVQGLRDAKIKLDKASEENEDECLEVLESSLNELCDFLGKKYHTEVQTYLHFNDIDNENLEDIYSTYHKIGESLKDEMQGDSYEITLDITHSFRWMPLLCHQALTEYDMSLDHIIYGDYRKDEKRGYYKDLSTSCTISKMNKALHAFDKNLNLELLSKELENKWPEMAECLLGMNNVIKNSALSSLYSVFADFCELMENTEDKSLAFPSFSLLCEELQGFLNALRKDFQKIKEMKSELDNYYSALVILNISDVYIEKDMLLQAALANEAVMQICLMGKMYNGKDGGFNTYTYYYNEKIQENKYCRNYSSIKNRRNKFGHNLRTINSLQLEQIKEAMRKDSVFLRKELFKKFKK